MKYRELYDLAKSQNPHLDIQVFEDELGHTIAQPLSVNPGENQEHSIASIFICPCATKSALGNGPKTWHIFLFRVAYFPLYWHMPF